MPAEHGHEPVRLGHALSRRQRDSPPPGICRRVWASPAADGAARPLRRTVVGGGKDYQQAFEIKRDPRIAATDEDSGRSSICSSRSVTGPEITDAVGRLRKARLQVEARRGWRSDAARIKEKLAAIEGALTRLAGRARWCFRPRRSTTGSRRSERGRASRRETDQADVRGVPGTRDWGRGTDPSAERNRSESRAEHRRADPWHEMTLRDQHGAR